MVKYRSTLMRETFSEQKKHKSVTFLSKAGRFFTVGASRLIVNYVVSFLFSTIIPNIWYIHATLFGILISITSNFLLNKIWTFEDRNFSLDIFFKQYSLFGALLHLVQSFNYRWYLFCRVFSYPVCNIISHGCLYCFA